MLTRSHFIQGGLNDAEFKANFGNIFGWLQMMIEKVAALGPAGAALAAKTVADVQAGNWMMVASDIAALWQMFNAQPAPAPAAP